MNPSELQRADELNLARLVAERNGLRMEVETLRRERDAARAEVKALQGQLAAERGGA